MRRVWAGVLAAVLTAGAAAAQPPSPTLAEQKAAMAKLAFMDGEWVGPAKATQPTGVYEMTQTERVGSLLDGTVKLIEGRGYDARGATLFNAFAVVSYDPAAKAYRMRSHAGGRVTEVELKLNPDGFSWTIPAGQSEVRYVAVVKDGTWTETGDYVTPNEPPRRFVELNLKRKGDSPWPAAGAVKPD